MLVQQERESLLRELHAELGLERKRFEARKPALSEEVRLQLVENRRVPFNVRHETQLNSTTRAIKAVIFRLYFSRTST